MQIEEPIQGNIQMATESDGICIGIDLGTTNSVATFVQDGRIVTIEEQGLDIIPSCVSISKDGNILIGLDAIHKINDNNYCTIQSIKRYIGNIKHAKKFDVFGNIYTPTQISAFILEKIKTLAEKQLQRVISSCVITVPANFDDNQRNETKMAAKMAGMDVKRVINEPTAAALAYGIDNKSEGIYLVYDLGGGTFDISILKMQKGIFRVIATNGDTNLGGDDIDEILLDYIAKKNKIMKESIRNFQLSVRGIKEHLSNHDIFENKISINSIVLNISITRSELESISSQLISKTIQIMQNTIQDANISISEIHGIILVGGMTRMPIIQEKIKSIIPCKIFTNLDPDKIVGIGAGIRAAGRKSGFENILLDICPLSIGIETMGGVVEKIIYRNTPIPCSAIQNFTTSHDNQTGIIIHIVQGEREFAKDCRSLGKIELKNIQKMSAGMAKVKITLEIDVDGILSVSAIDEISKSEISTEIKPSYGMDYKEMSDMLISAIENAKSDMQNKLLIESIENAKRMINTIEKALDEDGDLISVEKMEKISNEISKLEGMYLQSDRDSIQEQITELEKIATPFMESRTDKYLNQVVVGTKID